jgi:sugar phosphate isomerase/epimerase
MIKIGRSIRWYNDYQYEVDFSIENGFDFLQIWYVKGAIALDKVPHPKEKTIKDIGFPTIIHAVFDINEFEEHVPKVIEILKYLGHKELIIHPICESEPITKESIYKLSDKVAQAYKLLKQEGITLYIENNSRLDPINYRIEDLKVMFDVNKEVELLLDVAHIDSYEHLKGILKVNKPKMLHIADKHFEVIHEHLPLGQGNMDYKHIFTEYLQDFDGNIILEVVASDEEIVSSKKAIELILKHVTDKLR